MYNGEDNYFLSFRWMSSMGSMIFVALCLVCVSININLVSNSFHNVRNTQNVII